MRTTRPDEVRRIGEVIAGRYEVLRPLAQGGMGSIFLGRQLGLDRRVAIKLLPPDQSTPEVASLFRREAMAIKNLSHPNTIRIYDFGETDAGMLYLVMEYLEGEGLDQVVRRRGAVPERMVLRIAEQLLKSLIEAHARGIVHRDIKPSNVMLCRQLGEDCFVKLLDFGIAWHHTREAPEWPGEPGEVMGTPRYMSPEQVRGEQVDARSDLYSLGLTLYELAAGSAAFPQDGVSRVLTARLETRVVPLPAELQGRRLGAVISRAVAYDRDDRFSAAGDMLEALLAVPAPPDTPWSRIDTSPLEPPSPEDGSGPRRRTGHTDPTAPRMPGAPLPVGARRGDDPMTPAPYLAAVIDVTTDAVATAPTLPAVPTALVTPEGAPEADCPSQAAAQTAPPAPQAPVVEDPVSGEHPLSEWVRARIEQRLRRRAWTMAAVGLGAGGLVATLLWLVL